MCVVSMVGDHFSDKWKESLPYIWPNPFAPGGANPGSPWSPANPAPLVPFPTVAPTITREEFEQLRKEVLEMKELLRKAKKYDEDNGEKDCEMEQKIAILRKVAEAVGIDLDDIFGKKSVDSA